MKCQNLFSGKDKKNISIYCLLKILARVLNINLLLRDQKRWGSPPVKLRQPCD